MKALALPEARLTCQFPFACLPTRSVLPSWFRSTARTADRATLLRRLSLDLIGMPPTLVEADEFLFDDRPDAVERLTDRLLASPHFGEKWAVRWLDRDAAGVTSLPFVVTGALAVEAPALLRSVLIERMRTGRHSLRCGRQQRCHCGLGR